MAEPPGQHPPPSFAARVGLLQEANKRILAQDLHDRVGLVRYAPPELVLRAPKPLPAEWLRDLAAALRELTGTRWQVSLSDADAQPSLREQEREAEARVREGVLDQPVVRAAFDAFPGAELLEYSLAAQEDR